MRVSLCAFGRNALALKAMKLKIAAIRSGTDPVGALPMGSFPKTLEEQLGCPKCSVTYNLVVDWDQSISRWFEQESQPLIRMLKKAIFMGHSTDHRVTHFETEGVVVKSFVVNVAPTTIQSSSTPM